MSSTGDGDRREKAEKDLSNAVEHFRNAIGIFLDMTRTVQSGQMGGPGEARTIRALADATRLLMNEKQKLEKLDDPDAGIAGGSTLDLDAARDEIRSRLARIRRARGAGEVPS